MSSHLAVDRGHGGVDVVGAQLQRADGRERLAVVALRSCLPLVVHASRGVSAGRISATDSYLRAYRMERTRALLRCDLEQRRQARAQIKQAQAPIAAAGQQDWRLCACTASASGSRLRIRDADVGRHAACRTHAVPFERPRDTARHCDRC